MSEKILFADFGIEIIKRLERYFIRYDAGEIIVKMVEIEVTDEETTRARRSERDAYEVILASQTRGRAG
jgi:hypothetical protein